MFNEMKEEIVRYISKKERASFLDIVRNFKISSKFNKNFSFFLQDLKKEGKIYYSKKYDSYYVPKLIGNFDVTYNVNSNNYGFVFIEIDNIDTRISLLKTNLNPLKGDLININVYENIDYENSYFGIINSIVERKTKYIYCTVGKTLEIKPIYFNQNIEIKYKKDGLIPNSYAKFKIKSISNQFLELELVKTLSSISQPYSDINLMLDFYEVDDKFNDKVLDEINTIADSVTNKTQDNRVDLTNNLIITIDGEKTKDFDDAISVVKKDNKYILGVHIADVSYYVKENTALDMQAQSRGTSIYLLDKVVPMLPEKLSNGICSLNPNVDRYVITLESEIDLYGNTLKTKIYPATINSKYRLTYNQVENYNNESIINNDSELKEMIEWSYELSNILSKNKKQEGYIDFEITEPIIQLDEHGKAIGIKNKSRLQSEILIENFMVYANEQVSEYIAKLKIPSIYRVHENPSEEKINNLKNGLKTLNIKVDGLKPNINPKEFQSIFEQIKSQRFDELIKVMMLRTMQKAKYSSDNVGHFGLASEYYSHFTSPIRRYPDLLLHRIIRNVIFENKHDYSIKLKSEIDRISSLSSKKEEDALVIERKVNDIKKAEYYESKLNQIFEGTIISLLSFAIFVELDDKVDVMIHVTKISSEKPILSENNTILKCNDKEFKLGQRKKVKIISINVIEGKIDAEFID